jgi:hypothetical protein
MQFLEIFDFHLSLGEDDDFFIPIVFDECLEMLGFFILIAAYHGFVLDANWNLVGIISNQIE